MKTSLLFLALSLPLSLHAQDLVTAGTILEVSPKTGTVSIRPDSAPNIPILYYGMDRAALQTTAGQALKIDALTPGTKATVYYLQQGNQLFVSKLQIEAAPVAPPIAVSVPAGPAVLKPSPTGAGVGLGGDVTKQPGSKAAIDTDVTTQPGK